MHILNKLDELVDKLKGFESLSDCIIIKAYPFVMKPTNLDKPVIAVSLGEIQADNIELGGECAYANYRINADVFCPFELGINRLNTVIYDVINSQIDMQPASVSISKVDKDDKLECLFVKCGFTYYGELDLGGQSDE